MSVRYLVVLCLSVLLLAACGPRAQPEPEDVPASPTQSEAVPPVQPGTRVPVQPEAGTTVEPGTVESRLPEPGMSLTSPLPSPRTQTPMPWCFDRFSVGANFFPTIAHARTDVPVVFDAPKLPRAFFGRGEGG